VKYRLKEQCNVVVGSCTMAFGQGNGFDSELSGLRKNVIGMCAQLQASQPQESQEQLLKEIDGIISGWEGLATAYKNKPPAEYAKDPAWQGYFDEALDNFKIMRQKTAEQIKANFNALAAVVGKKDISETEAQFKVYLKEFGKMYIKHI